MIKVEGLSLSYKKNKSHKVHVLKNINLEVKQGEIFGVIGKSGAGKSTLLKCLNLLEKPDCGEVFIDGINLTKINKHSLSQVRQQIGVIFQGFNLLNSKTVYENVALPLILNGGYTKSEIKQKVENLLELVGLKDFSAKYPRSLSGGQKQRVGIARALSTNPKVLLSDEATSALDPETTNSILELLLEVNEKLGVTIFLITHEVEVVRKICDSVMVLDAGEIIESGKTVDVILHPKNDLTRKLLIEEESSKYLEQVSNFYKFNKSTNNHLILISFIGNTTFEPVLSKAAQASGVVFSILRGELGRVKKMPFGQLLVEINGSQDRLEVVFDTFKKLDVHYEVIA